jgi:8-oxo-dGTP diphosphatase
MHLIRYSGLVVNDGRILLMYRINKGNEYYVLPGGGMEKNENAKDTVRREIEEETTVKVTVNNLIQNFITGKGQTNEIYNCDYLSGEPQLSPGSPEISRMEKGNQTYKPLWVSFSDLKKLNIYPPEAKDFLTKHFNL